MIDSLALRDNARSQLLQIKTVEAGIAYLNKMSAIERWVQAEKKDAELQNLVAEQKLRTQRILGRLIREEQKRGSLAKQGDNQSSVIPASNDRKKTLAEIGITPKQSMNFQQIYSIPEETFEEAIANHKKAIEEANDALELTTAGMVRLAKNLNKSEFDHTSERLFGCFNRNKLIELRKKHNISQYELALETGVEASTISRIESGIALNPTYTAVAKFSEYFASLPGSEKLIMDDFKTGSAL